MAQGHHHHENKKDIAETRALQKVKRERENGVLLEDKPMPLIDIGVERISELIKSVTGEFEDSFQDAWVKVLERHPQSENEILEIANESSKDNAINMIKTQKITISFDTPLSKEDDNDFTLKDIIESPHEKSDAEIEHDIEADTQYVATSTGKINRKGYVHLDYDVCQEIKRIFPHDPLTVAIRKLAQMPPAERDKTGWHKWEDALIRVRYPWGGARACAMDLSRTLGAINSRARFLKVSAGKSLNSYKPSADWLNIPELAEKLNISYERAVRLISKKQIRAIRVKGWHQGHDGVFITLDDLDEYLKDKDSRKFEDNRYHFYFEEKKKKLLGKINIEKNKIEQEKIRVSQISEKFKSARKNHIGIVLYYLEHDKTHTQVHNNGELNHCVYADDGYIVSKCKHIFTPIDTFVKFNFDPFVDEEITCKKCLSILKHSKERQAL